MTADELLVSPIVQPSRHAAGKAKCANCPKTAAIRNMTRGPDGRLYGSSCARKLGYLPPSTRRRGPRFPRRTPGPTTTEETIMSQPTTTTRRFLIERTDGKILDGVLWPDGSCSLRWRDKPRSFVSWDTMADCEETHCSGDPKVAGKLIWIDAEGAADPVEGISRVQVRVTAIGEPWVHLESVDGRRFCADTTLEKSDRVVFAACWFDGGEVAVVRLPAFTPEVGTVVEGVLLSDATPAPAAAPPAPASVRRELAEPDTSTGAL